MLTTKNADRYVGLKQDGGETEVDAATLRKSLVVKLAAQGFAVPASNEDAGALELAGDLFQRYTEQTRLLANHLSPPDARIQEFIDSTLQHTGESVRLPHQTVVVDRYGLSRELSFPEGKTEYHNDQVSSYRLSNGVLHNPLNDRRTTKGVFHVAEGGLPIPADKVAVPLLTYARLLKAALTPPKESLTLPFTANWETPVETMVSLLLRPLVCPEVPGVRPEKRMDVRFFVPGGVVSNLDFVESIFGNSGDPHLPENNAELDIEHWTGHTGCVILAPHLRNLHKKDLGLPHVKEATDKQMAQGMCWTDPFELYNSGKPFKITMRDERGVMVTILADNYFGYCKKEVKTQIGFSANLSGMAEEEHAGGALAFSTYSLGTHFLPDARIVGTNHRFADALKLLGDTVERHAEGYATDKRFPHIHLLPEDMEIDLATQNARWNYRGKAQSIRVLPAHVYLHPSGYKVRVQKHPAAPTYRLVGTAPEGAFCHKPSTVSGGGKSEISKSLNDAVLYGPIYIGDFNQEMAKVAEIVARSYALCFRPEIRESQPKDPRRPLLSHERSLGSVVKLLTPNFETYTDEHNTYLQAIPNHVRAIVFAIKRFYRPEWGDDWLKHFSVDIVNGAPGHVLKLDGRQLVGSYLRVGLWKTGAWRTYKLRQDFVAADKVQMEDDITASTVVRADQIKGLPEEYSAHPSLKLAENCEYRLFQRPDEAVNPGFDKRTERDMAGPGLFASNFQPLAADEMRDLTEGVDQFELFTDEMKSHMLDASSSTGSNVCSANPRIVGGKPTKNPRYLQVRPDLSQPEDRYLAELGARLYRRISVSNACVFPVISVLSGRRNNPPDEIDGKKVRSLCVYNPIHYQELPELFMDYICSVTGKSPSTTGAGSEGALTKAPFNALSATADLNNALVSMMLTKYAGFSTAAGWVGPDCRVDHDISLLIPEVWCRLFPPEREPNTMIARGELEKIEDFEHEGKVVLASRLGYRITERFVHAYFGRVFDNPVAVFTEELLRPETQDRDIFADGVNNIVEAQEASANAYFEDGSVEDACPPLKALLHIMVHGNFEGKSITDPSVRALFTRESLLESNWYKARLLLQQERDVALWTRKVTALEEFLTRPGYAQEAARLSVRSKLQKAKQELERVSGVVYLDELLGTLGADPIQSGNAPKVVASSEEESNSRVLN